MTWEGLNPPYSTIVAARLGQLGLRIRGGGLSDLREDPTLCPCCGLVVLVGYTGHIPVKRDGRTEHYHTHCWENERRRLNPMSAL